MQHSSLGSITTGLANKIEILIPTPKLGQKPSIYVCLSPVKMVILCIQDEKDVSS